MGEYAYEECRVPIPEHYNQTIKRAVKMADPPAKKRTDTNTETSSRISCGDGYTYNTIQAHADDDSNDSGNGDVQFWFRRHKLNDAHIRTTFPSK